MQVGDLVRANSWSEDWIGIVVSVRNTRICSVMINGGRVIDQLIKDLEVICK